MVFKGVFPVTIEKVEIICKSRYVIGYSVERKAPLWVAEKITKANISASKGDRINTFRVDPAIPLDKQPTLEDFVGTKYDRGHMVPFEDLADDAKAANESFFLTNMVPEISDHNRGIWKAAEGRARKLPLSKEYIFVVTGPVFNGPIKTLKSGAQIPESLYKVVLSPTTMESYTIVVPNVTGLHATDLSKFFRTKADLKALIPGFAITDDSTKFTDKTSFSN
jgi:endonuclease G